jgi:hypothetical protein
MEKIAAPGGGLRPFLFHFVRFHLTEGGGSEYYRKGFLSVEKRGIRRLFPRPAQRHRRAGANPHSIEVKTTF